MKKYDTQNGWVLVPTIMIGFAITILLTVLLTFIANASSSVYNRAYQSMAEQAALSGADYALSCLGGTASPPPLTPNTDCSGTTINDASPYIDDTPDYRSTFLTSTPEQKNGMSTITVVGKVELLANGVAVKTYQQVRKIATGGVAYTKQVGVGGLSVCVIGANSALYCGGLVGIADDGQPTFTTRLRPLAGLSNATNISTSNLYNNCAIADGGKLYCWGLNDDGQLGTGDTTTSTEPREVTGIGSVTSVAASPTHTCAIEAGGQLYCWGNNSDGQLGTGDTTSQYAPQPVSTLTNVVSVTVSINNTCATTADGKLYCWGSNWAGQLGIGAATGNYTYRATPQLVTALSNVTHVSAGGMGASQTSNSACATTADGKLYCWGSNTKGQLGIGNVTNQNTPQLVSLPDSATQVVSGTHTCAITVSSKLYCWGANTQGTVGTGGMLGIGNTPDQSTPQLVDSLQDVVAVAASYDTTCAATANGNAYCWGLNVFNLPDWFDALSVEDAISYVLGQKTDPSYTIAYYTPQLVGQAQVNGGISHIASGDQHACITTADSNAYCWGANAEYQLGAHISSEAFPAAQKVLDVNNITSIATGGNSSCATTTESTLYCWGDDQYGVFKVGDSSDFSAPQQVTGLSNIVQAATSRNHACAVTADGKLYCWGDTADGQLGLGPLYANTGSTTPHQVTSLSNVTSVSAGYSHTCAVTASGHLYCWGDNSYGQLGIGSTGGHSSEPSLVAGLSHVVSVSTGESSTCAVTADNNAYCWGSNAYGQLGIGSTDDQETPQLVNGSSNNVASISTSNTHTCGSTVDGGLYCWGSNAYGQLGDIDTNSQYESPYPVDISNVTAVTTGISHTCVTTTGSKVYCWGANLSGELGIGYYSELETNPQLVPGPWKPSLPRIIY